MEKRRTHVCRVRRSGLGTEGFRDSTVLGNLGSKRAWRAFRGVCRMNVDRRANWVAVQGRSSAVDMMHMLETEVIVSGNDGEERGAKDMSAVVTGVS